jgi:murein DD-endopeptidase MepM/ murein hydrolase activator NlpD
MSSTPIIPLVVGNNGAWLAVRSSPAQGSCGVHGYPCRHPGVDVVGPAGTPVKAPEGGLVVAAADGSSSPYAGYGPWLVIIRGDSGKFHLLGHLDPAYMLQAPIGLRVKEGQVVGRTSSANHTHWEVRKKMVPDFAHGEDNFDNNVDPLAWVGTSSALLPLVFLGGIGLLVYLARR